MISVMFLYAAQSSFCHFLRCRIIIVFLQFAAIMLKKLQQKWNVSGGRFFLILCVFAITGTTTAWLTKVITAWVGFTGETFWLWKVLLRLGMLIIGYQLILLTVAFIFGQFPFFWQYEKKLLRWIVGKRSAVSYQPSALGSEQSAISSQLSALSNELSAISSQPSALSPEEAAAPEEQALPIDYSPLPAAQSPLPKADSSQPIADNPQPTTHPTSAMHNLPLPATDSSQPNAHSPSPPARLAVFASGAGSNAQKIIDFFRNDPGVTIALIVSNKPAAGVLQIAEKENIATLIIEKNIFFNGDAYVEELRKNNIDWIILAGFLWKVPVALIAAFPGRIVNIHPALLPKYGGKGMYGHFVHEAVIAAGEKQSGITIHYVDELFDHGAHIFQAYCDIEPGETPETLAKKVQVLEHTYFPEVIERLIVESKRQ